MPLLNDQQRQVAVEIMQSYLSAPAGSRGVPPVRQGEERDISRAAVIGGELLPLLKSYFSGSVLLSEFKTKVDGINKRTANWGFRGIKGQMFFNVLRNAADDEAELDQELKSAIAVPASEQIAASRIRNFASYIKRVGDDFVEGGGSGHGRPKASSITFFLSFFWQIQNPREWPVYYTNSVEVMMDLNLWQPMGDLAGDYLSFKHVHEELAEMFAKVSGKESSLYDVEHVFWFKAGKYDTSAHSGPAGDPSKQLVTSSTSVISSLDGYVPPIVANLPLIARDDPRVAEAAKRAGTSLSHLFEKSVDAAFTILGYETKPLGQGKGRVPDGLAKAIDDNYAILWDAKVRTDGYSIGTDDRTIREYITTQSRLLKKNGHLRNIYYVIISSNFSDDHDDLIRSLKMETNVNEIILMEASALVAIVDAKLRQPIQITLGPDGVQRLFTDSGLLTADMVHETLG